MNANELADYLDNSVEAMIMSEQTHIDQAATMLRQQQEQINNLKQWEKRQLNLIETQQVEIEELKTCLIVEQEHNERMVEDRSKYEALAHVGGVEAGKELKELTDEEIKSEAKYFCHSWHSQNPERLVLFARAILRKAQDERK